MLPATNFSFNRLANVDPGFEPRHLLSMRITLPVSRYPHESAQRRFYDDVLRRVKALGPVVSADVVNLLPMGVDDRGSTFNIIGDPPLPAGRYYGAQWRVVSSGYFQTMQMPVKQGRSFSEEDQGSPPVIIINEALARRYFGTNDPLRRQLTTGGAPEP